MAPPAAAAATQSSKKRKSSKGKFDPFIGSKFVTGLDLHIYQEFLKEKDAALVMFYDPAVPQCDWSRKHFLRVRDYGRHKDHFLHFVSVTFMSSVYHFLVSTLSFSCLYIVILLSPFYLFSLSLNYYYLVPFCDFLISFCDFRIYFCDFLVLFLAVFISLS